MHALNGARVVAALAVAVAVAGAGIARAESVRVAKKEGVGPYLADAKGMALYVFKKDAPGKSACSGPCVEKWPLFSVEKVDAPAPLKPGDFSTVSRGDGKMQTAYKGMPLYYFVGDKQPGDTTGEGVGEVWFLAKP